jgi:hypothetical protein
MDNRVSQNLLVEHVFYIHSQVIQGMLRQVLMQGYIEFIPILRLLLSSNLAEICPTISLHTSREICYNYSFFAPVPFLTSRSRESFRTKAGLPL